MEVIVGLLFILFRAIFLYLGIDSWETRAFVFAACFWNLNLLSSNHSQVQSESFGFPIKGRFTQRAVRALLLTVTYIKKDHPISISDKLIGGSTPGRAMLTSTISPLIKCLWQQHERQLEICSKWQVFGPFMSTKSQSTLYEVHCSWFMNAIFRSLFVSHV